jgi:hypothetical protein
VYGDNFFMKATYTVEARLLVEPGPTEALQQRDRAVLDERSELQSFEKEFKAARAAFEAAAEKLGEHQKRLDELLKVQRQFSPSRPVCVWIAALQFACCLQHVRGQCGCVQ